MKKLIILISLFFSSCSTCYLATGVQYNPDAQNYVEYIFPDSPAERAGIQVGGHLLAHNGGHLVIDTDGKIQVYDLIPRCLNEPVYWGPLKESTH